MQTIGLNEGFPPHFLLTSFVRKELMYNLPMGGPSFGGHILIAAVASVVVFFRKSYRKLLHKNG
jgi:hypothetical protein